MGDQNSKEQRPDTGKSENGVGQQPSPAGMTIINPEVHVHSNMYRHQESGGNDKEILIRSLLAENRMKEEKIEIERIRRETEERRRSAERESSERTLREKERQLKEQAELMKKQNELLERQLKVTKELLGKDLKADKEDTSESNSYEHIRFNDIQRELREKEGQIKLQSEMIRNKNDILENRKNIEEKIMENLAQYELQASGNVKSVDHLRRDGASVPKSNTKFNFEANYKSGMRQGYLNRPSGNYHQQQNHRNSDRQFGNNHQRADGLFHANHKYDKQRNFDGLSFSNIQKHYQLDSEVQFKTDNKQDDQRNSECQSRNNRHQYDQRNFGRQENPHYLGRQGECNPHQYNNQRSEGQFNAYQQDKEHNVKGQLALSRQLNSEGFLKANHQQDTQRGPKWGENQHKFYAGRLNQDIKSFVQQQKCDSINDHYRQPPPYLNNNLNINQGIHQVSVSSAQLVQQHVFTPTQNTLPYNRTPRFGTQFSNYNFPQPNTTPKGKNSKIYQQQAIKTPTNDQLNITSKTKKKKKANKSSNEDEKQNQMKNKMKPGNLDGVQTNMPPKISNDKKVKDSSNEDEKLIEDKKEKDLTSLDDIRTNIPPKGKNKKKTKKSNNENGEQIEHQNVKDLEVPNDIQTNIPLTIKSSEDEKRNEDKTENNPESIVQTNTPSKIKRKGKAKKAHNKDGNEDEMETDNKNEKETDLSSKSCSEDKICTQNAINIVTEGNNCISASPVEIDLSKKMADKSNNLNNKSISKEIKKEAFPNQTNRFSEGIKLENNNNSNDSGASYAEMKNTDQKMVRGFNQSEIKGKGGQADNGKSKKENEKNSSLNGGTSTKLVELPNSAESIFKTIKNPITMEAMKEALENVIEEIESGKEQIIKKKKRNRAKKDTDESAKVDVNKDEIDDNEDVN